MIQDIAPHTYHNEYKPVAPDKTSHILAYEEGKILMKKDGETMTLPSFGELEGKIDYLYENYIYLFSVDEEHFYLIPDLDPVFFPDISLRSHAYSAQLNHSIWPSRELPDTSFSSGTANVVSAAAAVNPWYMTRRSAR